MIKQEIMNKKALQAAAGENAQGGDASAENKKEAENELIDPETGKKITRKELQQRKIAAELAKAPINEKQKQQQSKKNELGFNMLRICNQ